LSGDGIFAETGKSRLSGVKEWFQERQGHRRGRNARPVEEMGGIYPKAFPSVWIAFAREGRESKPLLRRRITRPEARSIWSTVLPVRNLACSVRFASINVRFQRKVGGIAV
jgi:hypothetical protein